MQKNYGYTVEEIRALVDEYLNLPYGAKGPWLAKQPFSRDVMQRWRSAYLYGDLDRGLVPRQGVRMTNRPDKKARDLESRLEQERAEHAKEKQRLEKQVAKDKDKIDSLEESNLALGKAIGLLQSLRDPDGTHVQTFQPQLTDLQRQVLQLLDIPQTAYTTLT